jgi:ATP adenylyltransferase
MAKKPKKVKTSKKSSGKAERDAVAQGNWAPFARRDTLERPSRYQYVRKQLPPQKGCVFCEALKQGVSFESLVLHREDQAMIVMNKFPYNTAHTMVLPTRHIGDLSQLSEEEHISVQKLLKKLVGIIKKEYNCDGMNIGLNLGAVAGAGIPEHMHWHVVPRWFGDTNFFPLIAETKVLPERVEDSYARLRKHFTN